MKIPSITGLIRRRLLLNYRLDPAVVEPILPQPFRPKLVNGYSIAGICLIRLEEIRPSGLPRFLGVSSENCAHRVAVEWEAKDGPKEGVFIPRRDTGSRINSLAGGRIFPGVHHHSSFKVTDSHGRIRVVVVAKPEEKPLIEVDASEAEGIPDTSTFSSLAESSAFFEAGCVGYSSRPGSCRLDGLLLRAGTWEVTPLEILSIRSSFFDDPSIFPADSVNFDHGLLMRDIPHEWHSEPEIRSEAASTPQNLCQAKK